jgi:prolyl oligopeptidase family protein
MAATREKSAQDDSFQLVWSRAVRIRVRQFMQSLKLVVALFVLVGFAASPVRAQIVLGAAGAEGEPFRRQEWRVPSSDTITPAHAVLFRPPGDGPFRLALIAHASTQNVLRRAQMPQPEYRALAAFLVARGFAVLMPERLGHGATGGRYVEDQGGCDEADYARSGRAEISRALEFLQRQEFVRKDGAVVLGHSAGGWGALALANADPKAISEGDLSRHRLCTRARRSCQRFPQPDLCAAYADCGRGRVRQGGAHSHHMAGGGQ